jgi:hypothetical protein
MNQIDTYLIFEKKNEFYTNRALFYQDILRYSNITIEKSFKDRELTRWLLENNQEMRNYYNSPPNSHVPRNTRVENRIERVKGSVQDLIDLGLMQETGTTPAEKGGTRPVGLYGYTANGRFLASLVDSIDPNKRESAFSILQSILSIEPPKYKRPSHEKFLLKLYKKYKDRGVFGEFFMDRLKDTLEPHYEIKMARGAWEMQHTFLITIGDSNKLNLLGDLWEETLYEMTPCERESLLFGMNSEISQRTTGMYVSSKPTYGNFNLINFPELRVMDLLLLIKRMIL